MPLNKKPREALEHKLLRTNLAHLFYLIYKPFPLINISGAKNICLLVITISLPSTFPKRVAKYQELTNNL